VNQKKKLLAYLCIGTVLLLLFAAEEAYILKQWRETLEAQHRRSAIREQVLRLQRLTAEIDNGFRGYVLMRQSTFLAPMVAAEAEIPKELQRLENLTESTPALQGSVQIVRRRLQELVDTKQRLTLMMDAGERDAVLAYIRAGDGLALAKTIANVFDDLETRINREFEDADLSRADKQKATIWQLVATQAVTVLLGVLIMELLLAAFAIPQRLGT
jgi:CHASE3 domain sensor protein